MNETELAGINAAVQMLREEAWDEGHAAYTTWSCNPYRRRRLGEEPQQVKPPVVWGGAGGGGCSGGSGGIASDLETLKQNRDFWMGRSETFEAMHKSVEKEKNRMIDEVNKWKSEYKKVSEDLEAAVKDRNCWHKMYVELHDKVAAFQSTWKNL